MRLTRLGLVRYGHLTDAELIFPSGTGLHVVLGANEAGKSTALSAVADALFGFPHRSRHAFLHDTSELRIEFELCGADGRTHAFTRLKRRKDDLLDGAGNPVPEAALAALIGHRTRTEFEEAFGLDGERLRRGGASLLGGGGEVGQALFSAASGLTGAAALLQKLEAEAEALYTRRRSATKPFYVALDAHKAALTDCNERAVATKDYEAAAGELEDIRQAIGKDDVLKREMEARRSRLERIRRTLPALRERDEAIAALLELGDEPALPEDAASQAQAARAARDRASDWLVELRRQHAEAERARAADPPDPALLREADAIDAVAGKLSRAEAALVDQPVQEALAAQHARQIEACAARLGLDPSAGADALVARQPTDAARAALRRLVTEHARLSGTLRAAAERDEAARIAAERAAAEAKAAAAARPDDLTALDHAVREARESGRIDEDHAQAAADLAGAADRLARLLAGLAPRWESDVGTLRVAPVPGHADIRRHERTLKKAGEAVEAVERERDAQAQALADAKDRLAAASASGTLPTEEAITEARARRDHLWRLIRRAHLDGGPEPTADERMTLPDSSLGDALETAIEDADALADRRGAEAERLAQHRQALEDGTRAGSALARAEKALRAAVATQEKALAEWRAAWAPSGIEPADPEAMSAWLKARMDVLEAADAMAKAERRQLSLATQRTTGRALLIKAAAGGLPADGDDRLAPLLRAAEQLLGAGQEAAAAAKGARERASAAADALQDADRALNRATAERAGWETEWVDALAAATLPPGLAPTDAEAALSAWDDVATAAKQRNDARQRVAEMAAFTDGFAKQVAALCARVTSDLAKSSATDAVRTLVQRLAAARVRTHDQARQAEAVERLATQIAERAAEYHEAERSLAALRAAAGVVDDAALDDAITKAARAQALAAQRDAAERRLRADGDGLPLEALKHEAIGADPDAIAAEVAEVLNALRGIDDRNTERRQREGALVRELAAMEAGHNAAEAAQRAVDSAATAATIAARYARLHVARTLLGAALARFRAEQQAPLLRRAGTLFAALTVGRYARLEAAEDDDGKKILIAVTIEGGRCPADALSEGARDQLYLALRLATLEDAARKTSPLPFLADDLLASFDDDRARVAIDVLADLSAAFQIILFTHHRHIAALLPPKGPGLVQALGEAQRAEALGAA